MSSSDPNSFLQLLLKTIIYSSQNLCWINSHKQATGSPGTVLNVGQESLVIKANTSRGTLAWTTSLDRTHFCKFSCEYFLWLYRNVKLLDIAFFPISQFQTEVFVVHYICRMYRNPNKFLFNDHSPHMYKRCRQCKQQV